MGFKHDPRTPLGNTGFFVPPIVFNTAALGNVRRVITEQAKAAICGEWFRNVIPPVFAHIMYRYGDGMALEVLGRTLRRLEINSDEVVIQLSLDGESLTSSAGLSGEAAQCWEKSCQLLGDKYQPKLISVSVTDDDAWRMAAELKYAGTVHGVGVAITDWQASREWIAINVPDWIVLCGCTMMRHTPEMLAFIAQLSNRQIPVVLKGVFDCGFLVGGNRLVGRVLNVNNATDRSWLAWRKAFVALCDGHGVSPAHACIQFALSLPGVVSVQVDSSYPDRVAENIRSAYTEVPVNFWASMKEEGLLQEGISGVS